MNRKFKSLLVLSIVLLTMISCEAQEKMPKEPRLKIPTFEDDGCFVIVPVNKGYRSVINEHEGFLEIGKSEFKDSVYNLFLPFGEIPSLIVSVEPLNLTLAPTPKDFAKHRTNNYQKSGDYIDSINFKSFHNDEFGEVCKATYNLTSNRVYSVNYTFFMRKNVMTIGFIFTENMNIDPDKSLEKMKILCP